MPTISTSSALPDWPRFSYIGRVQPDDPADGLRRIGHAEALGEPARQRLVDDGDARRAGAVAGGEAAAGEHRDVERREVVGIDALEPGADALIGARQPSRRRPA